jgi:hypothetical protein
VPVTKQEPQDARPFTTEITSSSSLGVVYGFFPYLDALHRTDSIGQADKIATMPVPFETLIPYGIIIAVSSSELWAVESSLLITRCRCSA